MPMRAAQRAAVLVVCPARCAPRVSRTRSAIMSMAGLEVERLPLGAVRAPVEHRVCRPGLLTSCSLADPLGHSRPRETGESGSPSICTTCSSLTKTRWPQPTAQ